MIITALMLALGVTTPPKAARAHSLPLIVMAPSTPTPTGTLAILITGDGGWSAADRTIANRMIADGNAVVGLNSFHYFQKKRTSSQVGEDVAEIVRNYCGQFACKRVVLIGYSMGADVLPFVVPQIPDDVRSKIAQIHLVSLGYEAVFKFFPTQWVGFVVGHKFATLPQIATLHGIPISCYYGVKDDGQACKDVPAGQAELVPIEGVGHVMTKSEDELADQISRRVRATR